MNTNTSETNTAWDLSLKATLAIVEDLESALSIFKHDVTLALQTADPSRKKDWEELAVWDFKDVKRMVSKIQRELT